MLLALAVLACPSAMAAPGDTGTGTGTAQLVLIERLQLVNVTDLQFGRIAASATAGTVAVNPDTSACTTSASLVQFGTCQSAEFVGMGRRNMMVRIRVNSITNLTGPGVPMVLDTITFDTSPDLVPVGNGNSQRYRIIPGSGIFNFRIGGTLHVNANQAPGAYAGNVVIWVQYN